MKPNDAGPKLPRPPKSIAQLISAVVAICGAAATIYGYFKSDTRAGILGVIGIVLAVLLLIVVQRAIRSANKATALFYDVAAIVLVGFAVVCFILVVSLILPTFVTWLKQQFAGDTRPLNQSDSHNIVTPVPESDEQTLATLTTTCKPETNHCTVFLFDYSNDIIPKGEFDWFQTTQADRLNKGIRDDLQTSDLLKEIDFRVARCSKPVVIRKTEVANRAIIALKVPAIMWGYIGRNPDNKLIAQTAITFADDQSLDFHSSDEPVNNVMELLNNSVRGSPLAIASVIVGDIHLKNGDANSARKAFLHAKEQLRDVVSADKNDFTRLVDKRLKSVETNNPAASLKPIASK